MFDDDGYVESFGKVAARPSPKSIANVSIPKMLLLDKAENGFSNILSSKLVSTAMMVPSFSAKNWISLPASNSIGVISPHGFNASTMVSLLILDAGSAHVISDGSSSQPGSSGLSFSG